MSVGAPIRTQRADRDIDDSSGRASLERHTGHGSALDARNIMDEHSRPADVLPLTSHRWRPRAELMPMLGISTRTFTRRVNKGEIEAQVVNGNHLYRVALAPPASPAKSEMAGWHPANPLPRPAKPVKAATCDVKPSPLPHLAGLPPLPALPNGMASPAKTEVAALPRPAKASSVISRPSLDLAPLVEHISNLTAQLTAQAEELGKLREERRRLKEDLAQAEEDAEAALAWGSDLMTELINMECDLEAACNEGAQMLTELKARGARF